MNEFGSQLNQLIPRLRRYARALTGEHAGADDLVQDTLERAWSKLHLWRRGSDLRAWLFAIMHNTYVNQVRSRTRVSLVPIDGEAMEMPLRAAQTDLLEVRDLDAALRCLPNEQREVVLLIALERLSYEEAAKALNIPVGTVMSRLSRGREKLRLILTGAMPATPLLKVIK